MGKERNRKNEEKKIDMRKVRQKKGQKMVDRKWWNNGRKRKRR